MKQYKTNSLVNTLLIAGRLDSLFIQRKQ